MKSWTPTLTLFVLVATALSSLKTREMAKTAPAYQGARGGITGGTAGVGRDVCSAAPSKPASTLYSWLRPTPDQPRFHPDTRVGVVVSGTCTRHGDSFDEGELKALPAEAYAEPPGHPLG